MVKWFGSIQTKFTISFIIIILVCFSLLFITDYNNKQATDLYGEISQIGVLYSGFLANLEQTDTLLQDGISTSAIDISQAYDTAYHSLVLQSQDLYAPEFDRDLERWLVDLQYMVLTYTELGSKALEYLGKGDYIRAVNAVEDARFTKTLIYAQYNTVYSAVSAQVAKMGQQAKKQTVYAGQINTFWIAFGALVTLWVISFVSTRLMRPLRKLSDMVKDFSLEQGKDLAFQRIENANPDELTNLYNTFGDMAEKVSQQYALSVMNSQLQHQMAQEQLKMVQTERLLKESQLKALQARINPHFMFNSLNLIEKMAYIEGADQTAELMEALAQLMRYNMDTFHNRVTVAQELENLQDYLLIQQKRFGSRMTFSVEQTGEVAEGEICCLTLQPLVENAIVHGIADYGSGGEIHVHVVRQQDNIVITVADNGKGIPPEKLASLQKAIASREDDLGGSIGLCNVARRMYLLFGDAMELTITSEPEVKTVFRLVIPYRKIM